MWPNDLGKLRKLVDEAYTGVAVKVPYTTLVKTGHYFFGTCSTAFVLIPHSRADISTNLMIGMNRGPHYIHCEHT